MRRGAAARSARRRHRRQAQPGHAHRRRSRGRRPGAGVRRRPRRARRDRDQAGPHAGPGHLRGGGAAQHRRPRGGRRVRARSGCCALPAPGCSRRPRDRRSGERRTRSSVTWATLPVRSRIDGVLRGLLRSGARGERRLQAGRRRSASAAGSTASWSRTRRWPSPAACSRRPAALLGGVRFGRAGAGQTEQRMRETRDVTSRPDPKEVRSEVLSAHSSRAHGSSWSAVSPCKDGRRRAHHRRRGPQARGPGHRRRGRTRTAPIPSSPTSRTT